jgi:hypothetical protein
MGIRQVIFKHLGTINIVIHHDDHKFENICIDKLGSILKEKSTAG